MGFSIPLLLAASIAESTVFPRPTTSVSSSLKAIQQLRGAFLTSSEISAECMKGPSVECKFTTLRGLAGRNGRRRRTLAAKKNHPSPEAGVFAFEK
jgi:hypothetical protein